MKSIQLAVRAARTLALAVVLSASLCAQSVTWLAPGRWTGTAGGTSELRVESERAESTVRTHWAEVDLDWFFVRAAGAQRNFDALVPRAGEDFVRVELQRPGATLIGLDRRARVERVPGDELVSFLEARAATGELAAGWRARVRGTGPQVHRVRRVESSKLLLGVTNADGALPRTQTATSKSGQPCEIRPLLDPTAIRLPSDLPVRIYLPGGSEGVRLVARHRGSGREQSAVADDQGLAHISLEAAGVWSLEAHRALELSGDPEADFELQSATLIFRVPREAR